MSRSVRRSRTAGVGRCQVFNPESVPFDEVPWGWTKVLIGRTAIEPLRRNAKVMIKITVNAPGNSGVHEMHTHSDQDEVLLVLEGHGENVSEDGFVQAFGPGDIVYVPAGTPHEDRSTGGRVKFLVVKVPAD